MIIKRRDNQERKTFPVQSVNNTCSIPNKNYISFLVEPPVGFGHLDFFLTFANCLPNIYSLINRALSLRGSGIVSLIFMKESYIHQTLLPLGMPCNFVLDSEIEVEFYYVRLPEQLLCSD